MALLLAELSVLGSATARVLAGAPSPLTSDPYVLLSDLWQAEDALPVLQFVRDGRGAVTVDPRFDYLGFRTRLFAAVRPYDLHVNDAGRAHALASAVAALCGLAALAARSRRPRQRSPSPPE